MTRKELISILATHGMDGVPDPELRVATSPRTSLPFHVEFVPSDDGYGPHIRVVPDEEDYPGMPEDLGRCRESRDGAHEMGPYHRSRRLEDGTTEAYVEGEICAHCSLTGDEIA